MDAETTMTNQPETVVKKYPVILGLGGAGAAILEQFIQLPDTDGFLTILIDTDSAVVERSHAARKLLLPPDWGGSVCTSGCGGDVHRGAIAFTRERGRIEDILSDAANIVVCGGLGGGTTAGGLPTVISIIRGLKIASAILVTLPFDMELFARRTTAQQALREIQPTTDILIALPNDLLTCTLEATAPLDAALKASTKAMAHTVFGMASMMSAEAPLGGGYAQMLSVLKQERCDCTIGVGIAGKNDGLDRCSKALERLLDSPFLGTSDFLKQCDAAFLTVCGGPDLQIAELKRALEQAGNILPKNMVVTTGISISNGLTGRIQFTVIAIQYAPDSEKKRQQEAAANSASADMGLFSGNESGSGTNEANGRGENLKQHIEPTPIQTTRRSRGQKNTKGNWTQTVLPLEDISYGIFEGAAHKPNEAGEDLDLPTYYRLGLDINRG